MSDRLFVPLKTEHYRNFEKGIKEWELRGYGHRFNPQTVRPGRRVEFRRGYSTDDSLWGTIEEVKIFDSLEKIPEEIQNKIVPGMTQEDFVEEGEELLDGYKDYIVFRVELD